jgi:hypothetical protein
VLLEEQSAESKKLIDDRKDASRKASEEEYVNTIQQLREELNVALQKETEFASVALNAEEKLRESEENLRQNQQKFKKILQETQVLEKERTKQLLDLNAQLKMEVNCY